MPVAVLSTKFYCPPARETLVPRPRLVERLNKGLSGSLVLISAPAGYGKTSLLSEWRSSLGRGYPLAWLTLDQDDNDPVRFLTYYISALRSIKFDLGETALSILQSPRPPQPETILTSLINELSKLDQPFALVLDDYHVIEARPIHDAITFLLDHLPLRMHLVILTRADPPLPISRLRVRDLLTEIRAADLRFTTEEVEQFLNQVMKLGLSKDNVKALELSTEGWIAGLQLAAHSGLVEYGRNNISYISGMGSFFQLVAYYSDMPCQEDTWQEPRMMERCKACQACLIKCPPGAISPDCFLLHAERCLTFHNERPAAHLFPSSIDLSVHNCLMGCMLCQRFCPEDKPFLGWFEEGQDFSHEETFLLMNGTPRDQLPAQTLKKLEKLE